MSGSVGLYYPFINLPSDEWVKLAALYWRRVARIVPRGYEPRDSPTVEALGDFVENLAPVESYPVTHRFASVLTRHEERLRDRYGVDQARAWQPDPVTRQRMREAGVDDEALASLAYVHVGKLPPGLREDLVQSGLAVPTRGGDPRWIGVHPRVAQVYMTALAEDMARANRLRPISDDLLNHIAVSGWTVERLSAALLDEPGLTRGGNGEQDPGTSLAFIAIQAVVPTGLAETPVEKIVEIRDDYAEEFGRYQQKLDSLTGSLETLGEVESAKALQIHLQSVYDFEIKPQMDKLRRDLSSQGMDTTLGVLDMKVSAPEALTAAFGVAGAAMDPTVAIGTGIGLGLARMRRSHQARTRAAIESSPVAYLYVLEQRLQPDSLLQRIKQRLRGFLSGV